MRTTGILVGILVGLGIILMLLANAIRPDIKNEARPDPTEVVAAQPGDFVEVIIPERAVLWYIRSIQTEETFLACRDSVVNAFTPLSRLKKDYPGAEIRIYPRGSEGWSHKAAVFLEPPNMR